MQKGPISKARLGDDRSPEPRGRTVAIALVGFWVVFVLLTTLRSALLSEFSTDALVRRLIVASAGLLFAFGMYWLLARLKPDRLGRQVVWVASLSIPAASLFTLTNFVAFAVVAPTCRKECPGIGGCTAADVWRAVSDQGILWLFVFSAWGMLYLSLATSARLRASERRVGLERETARSAELRALRYQLNPHFLFNTLNTLSALVIKKDWDEAQSLIAEIGAVLHYALSADPIADVPVEEEVEMQLRLLQLEQRRLPDRLFLHHSIETGVAQVGVPALILQPLVENAIKHGVARSGAPVVITLRAATSEDGRLRLVVQDDAKPMPTAEPRTDRGFGLGLKNVEDRLAARFGDSASLVALPGADGGFKAEILMPLVLT